MLFNISSQGYCSSQLPVLKYKDGEECSTALVGLSIQSTSSILKEFTFCGNYNFRFIRECLLVGIEPDLVVKLWDFENNVGLLKYQGVYYRFYFSNQLLTPDSWQYICFTISSSQIRIVWNGKIVPSDPLVNLTHKEIKSTKIWLGGATFSDLQNKRFGGMIANISFWNDALQDNDLISITNNENNVLSSKKYDLHFNTIPKNPLCIDILDESEVLFHNLKAENDLLIQYKTNFNSSKSLCEGYGGNLTIPKSNDDMKTLAVLIKQSKICDFAFLGLKKSSTERNSSILDLKGNIVSYLKWGLNQPNGGKNQQCISTDSDSVIYDEECFMNHCFFCHIPENRIFILRGLIPTGTERKYYVTTDRKYAEIRGLTKTECFWKEEKWNFGTNLKLDNATNNMPPVGLKTWNNGQKFKFTQCKNDEFTCHIYGNCLPMNKRCDGHPDCPIDGSDEKECKIMTLGIGYDRRYSSVKNSSSLITLRVYDVKDIDEIHMSYTVNIRIKLQWHDSRIIFRNLLHEKNENTLDNLEIEKIWTPKLYISHSNNKILEAGQKGEGTFAVVKIHQKGSPYLNEFSEIDEDYLYHGTENVIEMVNYLVIKLDCKFDLKWYVC